MFILDNKPLSLDTPFEHDGVQYPANWLRLATPEEREAIGITEVPEQPRPDDRFYWVSGPDDNGDYTAVPKDLTALKSSWTSQINQSAWNILMPSDWMVVRKQEDGTTIPQSWTDYRAAVRKTAADTIAALTAAKDIDAFISSVTSVQWPVSPDAQQPGA
jgi:hypothetical protein